MSDMVSNINSLRTKIPASVKLVVVSKTRSVDEIMNIYNCGERCFGENRVQELLDKKKKLPMDIEWHLIGHLQTNKAKSIIPFVSMIHSVDSFRLLETINSESVKAGKVTDCLLQVHIAEEETKFGFSAEELADANVSDLISKMSNVRVCGVMGMASFTSDTNQVRKEFRNLKLCFDALKKKLFAPKEYFREISMGMSGDFKTAIEEGSTMVRIGSLIFGERVKK